MPHLVGRPARAVPAAVRGRRPSSQGGRHRRAMFGHRSGRAPTAGWAAVFPALLGPGRRAAWRRFVLRRVLAVGLVTTGYAVALFTGSAVPPTWR